MAIVNQTRASFRNHSFLKIILCFLITSLAFSGETPLPVEVAVFEEDTLVYSIADERRFAVFFEGALSIGGIGHTFNDDAIEQFGYNVDTGCEQDGAYFLTGVGKHFGRFSTFIYGEIGRVAPGALFDAHGPYIPPEVLLRMNMLAGGIELRYAPLRVRLGAGNYFGTAEVDLDYDTTQVFPSDSWETSIEDGTGWHFSFGYHHPVDENISAGVEWAQHFIDLKLGKNGTQTEPSEQSAIQRELRFVFTYQLPIM